MQHRLDPVPCGLYHTKDLMITLVLRCPFDYKAEQVQISARTSRPTMATPSPCLAGSDALKPGTRANKKEHKPKQNTDRTTKPSGRGGGASPD